MEFFDEIHKSTLYPEVWGQKTTLSSVKVIQIFWDTFLKIFPLWCWVNFDHPKGSKGVWWGNFPAPKVQSGVGRWPPPKQVAPGTWHLLKDAKSCSSGSSKSSKLNPFHAIFSQFSTRNGKIFSTQGPIRCGQVAIAQAGGTWHLQSPNIGQILFPCTLKIKQIWPISCQFCRFSTQKGICMQPKD